MKLNELEMQIVKQRIEQTDSIAELQADVFKPALFKTVVAISHISGGALPKSEAFLDMFIDELYIFLLEYGYGSFAITEIILAFRININTKLRQPSGITLDRVELKTNELSIEYISDILHQYSIFRNSIDRKFENFIDGYGQL